MQTKSTTVLNFLVETIWSPCLCEERYRDGLSIAVKLQPTNANSIHDRCIVDNLNLHPHVLGTNNQISVCGRPANFIAIMCRVNLRLTKLTKICEYNKNITHGRKSAHLAYTMACTKTGSCIQGKHVNGQRQKINSMPTHI